MESWTLAKYLQYLTVEKYIESIRQTDVAGWSKVLEEEHIPAHVFFCDGAFRLPANATKKHNRVAGIGVFYGDGSKYNVSELIDKPYTNIRAELLAIRKVFEIILREHESFFGKSKRIFLNIRTDSEFSIKTLTFDYKNITKNLDIIEPLVHMIESFMIDENILRFTYVRAHMAEPADKASKEWRDWHGNDRADSLASQACIRA